VTEPRTFSKPCVPCGGTGTVIRISPSWLRFRRTAAGLTLAQMAKRTRFSISYLSYIEQGQRSCPAKAAEAYGALAP